MKPKSSLILVFFVLLSTVLVGQNPFSKDKPLAKEWEIGFNAGMAHYYGDVSNRNYFEKISTGELGFGGALFGRYYFNEYIGLGAHFHFMSLNSVKENYSNGQPLNFALSGMTFQGGLHTVLNFSNIFFGLDDRPVSLYGTAGLAYIGWRSTLKNSLSDLVIRESFTQLDPKTYATGSLVFPAGLGLEIRLTNELRLNVEGSIHTIFSDDLDLYADGFRHDILVHTGVGLSYVLRYKDGSGRSKRQPKQVSIPRRTAPVGLLDFENPAPVRPEPRPQPPVIRYEEPPRMDVYDGQFEFRVQVIAMSKTRIDTEAFRRRYNIETPIIENTFSNLWRYSTGRFSNFREAEAYSRVIRSKGIHDAFVVAYRGNERIPITSDMKR